MVRQTLGCDQSIRAAGPADKEETVEQSLYAFNNPFENAPWRSRSERQAIV
jgi:hypothetical protein